MARDDHANNLYGYSGTKKHSPESKKPKIGLPPIPGNMSAAGMVEWSRLGNELLEYGVLTPHDGPALARLAELYAQIQIVQDFISKNQHLQFEDARSSAGARIFRQNMRALSEMDRRFIRMLKEFGLTPSSRYAIHATPVTNVKDDDPSALYLD